MYTIDRLDSRYAGQDLSHRDLRFFDFSNCTLYGADIRGSNLHGAKISLQCGFFDGLIVDDEQMAKMLLMLTKTNANPQWSAGIRDLVIHVLGKDRFEELQRHVRIIE